MSGPCPGRKCWLTSSRHPLRSGVTVVQPARGVEPPSGPAFPDSQHRKWWVARRDCPRPQGIAWQPPELTPTRTFVARPAHWPRGAVGRGGLTCPSRSVETYPLSDDRRDQCRIQKGTFRAGVSMRSSIRGSNTHFLGPAPFRVVVPCSWSCRWALTLTGSSRLVGW